MVVKTSNHEIGGGYDSLESYSSSDSEDLSDISDIDDWRTSLQVMATFPVHWEEKKVEDFDFDNEKEYSSEIIQLISNVLIKLENDTRFPFLPLLGPWEGGCISLRWPKERGGVCMIVDEKEIVMNCVNRMTTETFTLNNEKPSHEENVDMIIKLANDWLIQAEEHIRALERMRDIQI